ncbi:hypothetical protein PIB30_043898 [Stylosanthes scabra]|uniref:ADP-ribosyl cyclase/cyclic ADP-ribose hydrolase n=1 Tax=Stylosanthes scabra TaxID=79078 RepID=A0ABU6THH9_9FABA|nr:hypothetical protein [Stylosanthes scabra]
MASASSSSSIPPQPPTSYSHHVFLSFKGKTRTRFISHLYAALERKGIRTYKDDKNLRKGDHISHELVKAIEESMFAVIVFSPEYASSSWCLDELCKIIECKDKQGLQMVQVFYDVEPSDVRHQKGTFQKAFEEHKQKGRHDSEKVQRWRNALNQSTISVAAPPPSRCIVLPPILLIESSTSKLRRDERSHNRSGIVKK